MHASQRSNNQEVPGNHLGNTLHRQREEIPDGAKLEVRASICGEVAYNSAGFHIKRTSKGFCISETGTGLSGLSGPVWDADKLTEILNLKDVFVSNPEIAFVLLNESESYPPPPRQLHQ